MPTLAAGNGRRLAAAGFTLLELLVVLAIVAFASVGVVLAMRDGEMVRLEREALRLAAILESARARSQILGTPVRWRAAPNGFVFEGLEASEVVGERLPRTWQYPDTQARVTGNENRAAASALLLGPEPLIGPQALVLQSRVRPDKQIWVATDGVRPFALRSLPP